MLPYYMDLLIHNVQKEFMNMKSHSQSDAKLLLKGAKRLKDDRRLDVLYIEYERLKKKTGRKATAITNRRILYNQGWMDLIHILYPSNQLSLLKLLALSLNL